MRKKILGSSLFCELAFGLLYKRVQRYRYFLGLKNENEETLLKRRRITLLGIPLCTLFTTFPRKFV